MARGPHPDTVLAVQAMLDGFYGLRYGNAIAKRSELSFEDARKALEVSLTALLPRVRSKYSGDLLACLTSAVARALYGGMPGSPSPMIRYRGEAICVDRFVERVCERDEPYLEDCLKAELFYFFSEEDPGPYKAALAMPGA